MYCWSLAWRILSIILLACEMCIVYGSLNLTLPLFEIGMKTDLFQSCGHCQVFQICWHTEYNTLTASSFRICNSSTGIPSLPLALFVVRLHKAHLTLHSRMSGSRWVIAPPWCIIDSEITSRQEDIVIKISVSEWVIRILFCYFSDAGRDIDLPGDSCLHRRCKW